MRRIPAPSAALLLLALPACGTFIGIPAHGGGKRFAVEQELIAASARAAAKGIDVTPLVGRKCALSMITIGDEGGGNMIGGRYSFDAAIRGEYASLPDTRTSNTFPVIPTTSETRGPNDTTVTDAETAINFPSRSRTQTDGETFRAGAGASLQTPAAYRAEPFLNPKDSAFLNGILIEALLLRGVQVVPQNQADLFIYVTVDVFGTVRSRTEYLVYNKEKLTAKTALQVVAFDKNYRLVLPPRTAAFEAAYVEKYLFWLGPFWVNKIVARSEPPLMDHPLTDFRTLGSLGTGGAGGGATPPPLPGPGETGRTRPNEPPVPPITPDPSRPEDVKP